MHETDQEPTLSEWLVGTMAVCMAILLIFGGIQLCNFIYAAHKVVYY